MNQIQWSYRDEIAPLFPNDSIILGLCTLIDLTTEQGRKTGDFKEHLLTRVYDIGTLDQFTQVHNFIEGGF